MKTPYIVIDKDKMENNIKIMNEKIHQHEVHVRPHIKTHKTPEIAQLQIKAGAIGITVATISEAEIMAENGINDIFIAYPIVDEEKAIQICQLQEKLNKLIVGVDSFIGASVLQKVAAKKGVTIDVRVEIDTGLKRTGVSMENCVEFIKNLNQMDALIFDGIYTFRGAVLQGGEATLDLQAAGVEEGNLMVQLADEIKQAGIEVRNISVGSTPTAASAATVEGITEVRPGTYVFNDAMQVSFGVCDWKDCAAYVVATVVSKHDNRIVIDGGSKTFATDVQPGQAPLMLNGFGRIIDHHEAVFTRMNEEHGVIEHSIEDIQIGDRIKVIPNHICSTVNLHDYVYFKERNGSFEKYKVKARGKLQ